MQKWSEPRVVAPRKNVKGVARFADVAVGASGTYIVGDDIPFFDSSTLPASPLTAVTLAGVGIGKPEGQFNFVMPKVVLDSSDQLHMIWAESEGGYKQIVADMWPPRNLTTLWSSLYSPPRGWSLPTRIYAGKPLLWGTNRIASGDAIGVPSRTPNERIGLVLSTFTSDAVQPLVWLPFRNGAFVVDSIPTAGTTGSVMSSLVADSKDLYLAFIAADASAPGYDGNSVFFQRSADAGHTWSRTQLVYRAGARPASDVQVIVDRARMIHLVWLQRSTGDSATLQHTVSRDGFVWVPSKTVVVAAPLKHLRAVIDAQGKIHAVWENWSHGPELVRIEHVVWSATWSAPTPLFPSWRSYNHSLALTTRGVPLVVFEGSRTAEATTLPLRTLYSELTP